MRTRDQSFEVDLSVSVLTASFWPTYLLVAVIVPPQVPLSNKY